MKIAILALQGAFAEHEQMLHTLGVETVLIRNLSDWNDYMSAPDTPKGLIIPGGESTAMTRIMNDEGLTQPLHDAIADGLPVFGTCAGLIMLDRTHLGTMDVVAKRNAYGRQLGSFSTEHEFKGIGRIPMTFIRAPYIEEAGEQVEILSTLNGRMVAARQGRQLVCAFHPELNTDTQVHRYFVEKMVAV